MCFQKLLLYRFKRAHIQSKVSSHPQERDTFVTHSMRKHDLWHMTCRHFGKSLTPRIGTTRGQWARFPKIWFPDILERLLKKSSGILFMRGWCPNTAHCNSHVPGITKKSHIHRPSYTPGSQIRSKVTVLVMFRHVKKSFGAGPSDNLVWPAAENQSKLQN